MERERESHSVNPDVEGYLLDETIIGLAISNKELSQLLLVQLL